MCRPGAGGCAACDHAGAVRRPRRVHPPLVEAVATAVFTPIADPEAHMPKTRFNDGKPDRQGRFWSGSMFEVPGEKAEFIASLYRMDTDLSVHRTIEGIGCCSGLAWSPDSKTMYFSDSQTPFIRAYDFYPATRDIANQRGLGPL